MIVMRMMTMTVMMKMPLKTLKQKKQQQEKKAKALEVAEKIQRIKEQTREEVLKNRAANKKRMDILRRQQQRKKMGMQKEMSMLKMEMTAQMLKASSKAT